MNERIEKILEQVQVNEQVRRLAKQAGCTIDQLGYGEGNLEKFAELIVRECAEIANQYYKGAKHGPGFMICEEIKQHFGVEE